MMPATPDMNPMNIVPKVLGATAMETTNNTLGQEKDFQAFAYCELFWDGTNSKR